MSLSAEVRLLIQYMVDSGVPHQVSSTTGGRHSATSYHYRQGTHGAGLAVDFDDFSTPAIDTPGLAAIYQALEPLGPHVAELIYSGPGGGFWKNGKRTGPYAASSHHNHVHIAVPKGTFVIYPKEPSVPESNRTLINAPIVGIAANPNGPGVWLVSADGGIFALGGAPAIYPEVEFKLPPGGSWVS